MDDKLIYSSLIYFVAFFVRGLTGFGAGLIGIPVMAMMYPLHFVVPLHLFFETLVGFFLLPKAWKDVDWRQVGNLSLGMFVGNLSGAYVLAQVGDEVLKAVLAVVVLCFAVHMGWSAGRPATWKVPASWAVVFGLVGGVFGGALGMSGPLIVLYLANRFARKEELRATLIGLFQVVGIWTFGAYIWHGLFTEESVSVGLRLFPTFLIALLLGQMAHVRISELIFRRVMAGVLLISGLLLVFG